MGCGGGDFLTALSRGESALRFMMILLFFGVVTLEGTVRVCGQGYPFVGQLLWGLYMTEYIRSMVYVVGVRLDFGKKLKIELYEKVVDDEPNKYKLIKIITVPFENPGTRDEEDNPVFNEGPFTCSFNHISFFLDAHGPLTLDEANVKINNILLNARNYFIDDIPDSTQPLIRL